jgi:hypothetical protein
MEIKTARVVVEDIDIVEEVEVGVESKLGGYEGKMAS